MKKLLLLVLLLTSTPAWGIDKDGEYETLGARSCGRYIDARSAKDLGEAVIGAWIGGGSQRQKAEGRRQKVEGAHNQADFVSRFTFHVSRAGCAGS